MKRRTFLQLSTGLVAVPLVLKTTGCSGDDGGNGPSTSTTTGGGPDAMVQPGFRIRNSDADGVGEHPHSFVLLCADEDKASVTYTAGGSGHTHRVTLTGAEITMILAGETVNKTTSDLHPHTWAIAMPSDDDCTGPANNPPDSDVTSGGW